MRRLAAWWRYRRRLAGLVSEIEDQGYEVSPAVYRRLAGQARQPVLPETEKGL